MKPKSSRCSAILVLFCVAFTIGTGHVAAQSTLTCRNRPSPCFRRTIRCPPQCPFTKPSDPKAKGCYLDCNSPTCEAVCRGRKPNCNGVGSGCYDPRFIGGDGVVFYFHGRRDEHFSLVSDTNLQINARFIGIRPTGRTRDSTWIQALGLMFGSHTFTIDAARADQWDDSIDHFKLSYDGEDFKVPEGHLSEWRSTDNYLKLERTARKNSAVITLDGAAEISVNVVPINKEDDRIHHYHIPSDDCFTHLEIQFKFLGLSPEVEGVLGRTYHPGFENPAKPGVAMPVVGGEDKYRTSSLLSADCNQCIFSPTTDI